jgi:hypothetical protein
MIYILEKNVNSLKMLKKEHITPYLEDAELIEKYFGNV